MTIYVTTGQLVFTSIHDHLSLFFWETMRSITFIRTRLSKYSLYLSSRFFSASPPDPPDHPEVLLRKQPLLEHLRLSSLETCEAFKSAMRKVPQQVVVVTTGLYQPELRTWLKRGVTCSTFSSVSYHPPIISFCLNQGSRLHELIKTTGKFAVHVLAQDQVQQGIHFSKPALDSECQFFKVPHVQGEEGLPIILGSLAVFVCDSHSYHGVGDHTVWYGNVTGVSVSETLHDPLIYFVRFKAVSSHVLISSCRLGIQKYNEKNRDKIKTGYHETITMFFIHLVSDAIVSSVNANESFEEFLIRNQHLVNKDLLFEYYNKETLFQEDARNRFIEPDKKSLP
uniref:Flavin reductase like domain-containing protein n=1 Tax=Biomphalaria glabrata TaxID=6526 RepID=A0A2C9KSB4_BIOGL